MSDDWDFYFLRVDDEPASIFVDLGLRAAAPVKSHPTMVYLRIFMNRPRPDGLSSDEEFDDLVAVEDRVAAGARDGNSIYAGRNTSGGNRDLYFYVADLGRFEDAVRAAMKGFPHYQFETRAREDPDWEVYRDFLYPSEANRQCIMNRRVREQLRLRGDNADVARQIDHFVWLPSLAAQAAFAAHVQAEGFTIIGAPREPDERKRFSVEFSRSDGVAHIDDVVLPLFRKAKELGGSYDGWGCEVPD